MNEKSPFTPFESNLQTKSAIQIFRPHPSYWIMQLGRFLALVGISLLDLIFLPKSLFWLPGILGLLLSCVVLFYFVIPALRTCLRIDPATLSGWIDGVYFRVHWHDIYATFYSDPQIPPEKTPDETPLPWEKPSYSGLLEGLYFKFMNTFVWKSQVSALWIGTTRQLYRIPLNGLDGKVIFEKISANVPPYAITPPDEKKGRLIMRTSSSTMSNEGYMLLDLNQENRSRHFATQIFFILFSLGLVTLNLIRQDNGTRIAAMFAGLASVLYSFTTVILLPNWLEISSEGLTHQGIFQREHISWKHLKAIKGPRFMGGMDITFSGAKNKIALWGPSTWGKRETRMAALELIQKYAGEYNIQIPATCWHLAEKEDRYR